MQKFITTSSAAAPLGLPTGRKCLKVATGQFTGRIALLYAASPTTIAMVWSDAPYAVFSSPVNVVTDAADKPFDAFISSSGDIYVAYTEAVTFNLRFVKLTFSDGLWSVGSPVTVFDGDDAFYPCIYRLVSGYLWISYTRLTAGSYYISAKMSGNDGASWGTVSNPGDTLSAGSTSAYSQIIEAGSYQYIFYSDGGSKIAYRSKLNIGVLWNSEVVLATGLGFSDNLSAVASDDGRIGLGYVSSSGLAFREFSGSSWMGETLIDANPCLAPIVSYQGGVVYLLYHRSYGTHMNLVYYAKMVGTAFTGPLPLDDRKSYLEGVQLYSATSGSYQNRSSAASSTAAGDVLHTGTGALVKNAGDAIYLGMNRPFHFLHFILSTVGVGGEVVWKYWDGQNWTAFTPASGGWHFTSAEAELLLWNDYASVSADWQKKTVSGQTLYWICASVVSHFTTAPIGTQITSITNLSAMSGVR